jgi:ribose transport system permease protein
MAAATLGTVPEDDRPVRRGRVGGVVSTLARSSAFTILVIDIVLVIVFTALSPGNRFGSLANFESLMHYSMVALLLALGMTMVVAAEMIDLSLGANLILSSVFGTLTLEAMGATSPDGTATGHVEAILAALAVCLATGLGFGLINGLIVTKLGVTSLIATLGTLSVGTGAALVITNGTDKYGLTNTMQEEFGIRMVGPFPLPMLLALVIALVLWTVLRQTGFGVRTLAIGSNPVAAQRAGIRVDRHKIALLMISGGLAGLAGFVDLSIYLQTAVTSHVLDPLNALTAVVIGGTALTGGRASIPGTIFGCFLAAILLNGLIVLGITSFYQQIATGAILVAAVALDYFRTNRRLRVPREKPGEAEPSADLSAQESV